MGCLLQMRIVHIDSGDLINLSGSGLVDEVLDLAGC